MRLLHIADLHLDSPIKSGLSPEKSKIRREELLRTFSRIFSFANDNGVSALLVCGDMFDNQCVSRRSVEYVLSVVRSYPDIVVYYLKGNHDDCDEFDGVDLPENLVYFDSTLSKAELDDNICVYACEDIEQISDMNFDHESFNILMMHGDKNDLGGGKGVQVLRHHNVDYLALGHFHSYTYGEIDERGTWCYCGCPNGRGFDECGTKGVVLLDIADSKLTKQFIPMSDRVYHEFEVDMTNLDTSHELIAIISEMLKDVSKADAVKVNLVGECDESLLGGISLIAVHFDEYFSFAIDDKTSLCVNHGQEGDISLRGEFVRLVETSELDDQTKKIIKLCGLAALSGEELPV